MHMSLRVVTLLEKIDLAGSGWRAQGKGYPKRHPIPLTDLQSAQDDFRLVLRYGRVDIGALPYSLWCRL